MLRPMRSLVTVLGVSALVGFIALIGRKGNYTFPELAILVVVAIIANWLSQKCLKKVDCPACHASIGRFMDKSQGIINLRMPLDVMFCPVCGVKFDDESRHNHLLDQSRAG